MPIHDWARVDAGIFHDFHLEWISRIKHALNSGILPPAYYALAEQHAGKFEPDVLTLRGLRERPPEDGDGDGRAAEFPDRDGGGGVTLARPRISVTAEADESVARRRQRAVVVRHVSGDDVVAMIEIVSPGNKDSRKALALFVEKAAWLLDRGVHLLILDLLPPAARDPNGIHAAIWDEIAGQEFRPPEGKPLTLAAYERDTGYRAYVEPVAVGDRLPGMPLFLRPGGYVDVPLEATYAEAFAAVPRRWRAVIEGA